MSDSTQTDTWYEYFQLLVPEPWRLNPLALQFIAVAIGIPATAVAQALSEAWLARCMRQPSSPNDALPLIGSERSMNRYSTETNDGYRARLGDAWNAWQKAGDESAIVDTLSSVGFPGARVETPLTASVGYPSDGIPSWPASSDYWSQFRVFVPITVKDSIDPVPICGDIHRCGDGTVCGGSGELLGFTKIAVLRQVIEDWKPVNWIAREIVLTYTGSFEEHHRAWPI